MILFWISGIAFSTFDEQMEKFSIKSHHDLGVAWRVPDIVEASTYAPPDLFLSEQHITRIF
jgi:hypothetical protein